MAELLSLILTICIVLGYNTGKARAVLSYSQWNAILFTHKELHLFE